MRFPTMIWLGIFSLLFSASLFAEDQVDKEKPAVKTGKERMVSKAADPQRLDDCKVPSELRDPNRPRPNCSDRMATDKSDGQESN